MIHQALGRRAPIELSSDRRITGRVRRLAAVSAVALGVIASLAMITLETPTLVDAALVAGWITMPTVLVASLRRPALRYGLVVPSTLVGLGLGTITLAWLPGDAMAASGWALTTAGVLLGAVMGLWFWFRLLPVPTSLEDPESPGRWAVIAVHVALISIGIVLVIIGSL